MEQVLPYSQTVSTTAGMVISFWDMIDCNRQYMFALRGWTQNSCWFQLILERNAESAHPDRPGAVLTDLEDSVAVPMYSMSFLIPGKSVWVLLSVLRAFAHGFV